MRHVTYVFLSLSLAVHVLGAQRLVCGIATVCHLWHSYGICTEWPYLRYHLYAMCHSYGMPCGIATVCQWHSYGMRFVAYLTQSFVAYGMPSVAQGMPSVAYLWPHMAVCHLWHICGHKYATNGIPLRLSHLWHMPVA